MRNPRIQTHNASKLRKFKITPTTLRIGDKRPVVAVLLTERTTTGRTSFRAHGVGLRFTVALSS